MDAGISTEEQLAAAIEADQWYDSDSDTEETDSSPEEPENGTLIGEIRSDWTQYFWNTGDQLDNGNQPPPTIDVDTILKQLNMLESESVDFGDKVNDASSSKSAVDHHDKEVDSERVQNGGDSSQSEQGMLGGVREDSSAVTQAPPTAATDTIGQLERPKYYCIAHELLTTERTYVQSLRLLEKVVHGAIKTSQLANRPILSEQARKEVFLNMGEIYALNFDLLQELEDRIKNWDSNPMIADVIAKRAPFFKLYSMYSARFDSAQVAYCKWLKSSKRFAELIKLIETGPLCKGLPVSSYMLCPVQRVPRYKLLLEDYLKHLPEGHSDIENTKAALAAISEAAEHMNERIIDLENQAKVVQMQKTFVGRENIVAPGRKYIGRGPVYFVPGSKIKQRVLFLFSDILLIAGITAAGRYKVHHTVPLRKMLVSVVQSPTLKNAFCIVERGSGKPFRFCTKSIEERTKWITELCQAKTKDEGKFITLSKHSPYAAILNDPEAHSSILDVLNDPSFEHNQPSWVRRSLHMVPRNVRKGFPFTSFALAAAQLSGQGSEGVASVGVEEVDFDEGMVTEFESDRESGDTKVLRPGLDNSLSSYVQHLRGQTWESRWFVLTSRTLVCFRDHSLDVPNGTLLFAGYTVTIPQPEEVGERIHTRCIKLCHLEKSTHIFQLPTSHEHDRWFGTMQEILLPDT